ncbi:MAG: hypothetical protein WCE79_24140 [Xanthobacteraceae bacterium]
MSLTKPLCAATALLALATPALAQSAVSSDLHERNAYVLDMQGKMWSTRADTNGWSMTTRSARPVPRGTVFFVNNGPL